MSYDSEYIARITLDKPLTEALISELNANEMFEAKSPTCIVDRTEGDVDYHYHAFEELWIFLQKIVEQGYVLNGFLIYHGENFEDVGKYFFVDGKAYQVNLMRLKPEQLVLEKVRQANFEVGVD